MRICKPDREIRTDARRAREAGRGFTLVEVLIVVMILGIAAVAVMPHMGSRDDLKAAAAARLVMADLIYAQNRAIALQEMHFVEFHSGGKQYKLMTKNPGENRNPITHPIHKTQYIVEFGSGPAERFDQLAFDPVSFDGQRGIAFDELGTPYFFNIASQDEPQPMTSGSITIKSGSFDLTITIEPFTGEIRVQ